jgi:hypothetical protein
MLSSYPVVCPYVGCSWTGNLVPSHASGGAGEEIASRQPAWFRCPRCQRDWEAWVQEDKVTVLPVLEGG